MKPILIVYATREGHTRLIAEHISNTLRNLGATAEIRDAKGPIESLDFGAYEAAILAASIHQGKHEREMVKFVKAHKAQLERLPTVFLSASMAAAGATDEQVSQDKRAEAEAEAARSTEQFFTETGWRPTRSQQVAGALLYKQYNWLVRSIIKRISKSKGMTTDTSRDHDFTDWIALDRFVADWLRSTLLPSAATEAHAPM